MIVLDNFLPNYYEDKIKETLLSSNFPWYFLDDVTSYNSLEKKPGLFHLYVKDGKVNSYFFDFIKDIINYSKDYWSSEYSFNNILLARSFLQLPLNIKSNSIDNFHIDQVKKHTVFLYYVDDSDGDTIILNKKYNGEFQEDVYLENNSILKKISPKKGRLVIFDGYYYHTAEQPQINKRCVINFNLE